MLKCPFFIYLLSGYGDAELGFVYCCWVCFNKLQHINKWLVSSKYLNLIEILKSRIMWD